MEQFNKADFLKRLYKYSLAVIRFVEKLPRDQVARVLGNQFLRSGTSTTANVIEAQAASSKRDYINFYNHALKSANESRLWICLLRDSGKCSREDAELLLRETTEIANILGSSILTMKNKKK